MSTSKGTNRLARVLNARIKKYTGQNIAPADMGKIQAGKGLILDGFPATIPPTDYYIDAALVIAPGDRVLVVWAGGDPVITAKIKQGGT